MLKRLVKFELNLVKSRSRPHSKEPYSLVNEKGQGGSNDKKKQTKYDRNLKRQTNKSSVENKEERYSFLRKSAK